MKVLVIGSGGREHALCWSLSHSERVSKIYCAPGNPGISDEATCVDLDIMDFDGILAFCISQSINFVVIGPEAPLVGGLIDRLETEGIASFGPSAAAAKLEGSKGFMKDLCKQCGIPTARYKRFSSFETAKTYILNERMPIVIKADGLAAGKGVIIAESVADALAATKDILGGMFGPAGTEVVIEEFLPGEEASYLALVDGTNILPLETAQDHKAVGEGDTGPNTGGMGAYSPAPVMSEELCNVTLNTIVKPIVAAMAANGTPFKGVFYAGLMISNGTPKLLEVNVRFGDPECQAILFRLKSDLFTMLQATWQGALSTISVKWSTQAALCVVMASQGYPGSYIKNSRINILDTAKSLEDIKIFHAGTAFEGDKLVAVGGRVLGITALGQNILAAQTRAYETIRHIKWPNGFYRKDIGWRAIQGQ